ncbi:jg22643 [Pararge aegeria aegeria]|uniref:Jg22643 protein n=1 Tax=Pararge aegeria aegeria TaxID=348720 RepID=A0A8S4R8F6_9NEOP|nr:jg22643 [Pararge aegeria aegeria]
MTGELSRTGAGGRVGIWSGAAKTIQGPLLWHFCRLTGLRGRGHYGAAEGWCRGGEGIRSPAAPPRAPASPARTRHPSSICT